MTGIKRWRRVVLDAELDCLGNCLAGNFGRDSESKIDAGSDTTRGDHVALSNALASSWVAPTSGSRSVKAQWVVARRPLSIPATPKMNAPVQTEVTYFAVPACRRTNSIVLRSPIAWTTQ